jgi:hypothetical protein
MHLAYIPLLIQTNEIDKLKIKALVEKFGYELVDTCFILVIKIKASQKAAAIEVLKSAGIDEVNGYRTIKDRNKFDTVIKEFKIKL